MVKGEGGMCGKGGEGAWQRGACMAEGGVWQRGACVAKGGMCGEGGHVWQRGGACVAKGACMAKGVCVPCTPPPGHHKIQSVNARPVRILLEYILVLLEKLEYNDGGGNSD